MKNSIITGNVFRKMFWIFLAAVSFYTAAAQTKRDIKFAKCAIEDGMAEVQLGKLALSKATSGEVKMHAQHMIDDHSKANEELKTLAARKNISLPTSISEKKQRKVNKLNRLSGTDFDKRYSKCMVQDHKKAIWTFNKEAKRGDDTELKTWANNMVPTLESHLKMWKETCKTIKRS